jgi:hypothetical protein
MGNFFNKNKSKSIYAKINSKHSFNFKMRQLRNRKLYVDKQHYVEAWGRKKYKETCKMSQLELQNSYICCVHEHYRYSGREYDDYVYRKHLTKQEKRKPIGCTFLKRKNLQPNIEKFIRKTNFYLRYPKVSQNWSIKFDKDTFEAYFKIKIYDKYNNTAIKVPHNVYGLPVLVEYTTNLS